MKTIKIKNLVLYTATIILLVAFLAGCSAGAADDQEPAIVSETWTGNVQIEGPEYDDIDDAANKYVFDDRQPFAGIYLTDQHPDVVEAKQLAKDYLTMYQNTSYETFDPTDFAMYYGSENKAYFEAKEADELQAWFEDNQIELSSDGNVKFVLVTANKSLDKMRVNFEMITTAKSTEEYGRNGTYEVAGKLWLIKENNLWRIDIESVNFVSEDPISE